MHPAFKIQYPMKNLNKYIMLSGKQRVFTVLFSNRYLSLSNQHKNGYYFPYPL